MESVADILRPVTSNAAALYTLAEIRVPCTTISCLASHSAITTRSKLHLSWTCSPLPLHYLLMLLSHEFLMLLWTSLKCQHHMFKVHDLQCIVSFCNSTASNNYWYQHNCSDTEVLMLWYLYYPSLTIAILPPVVLPRAHNEILLYRWKA